MANTVQLLKDGQPVYPITDVSLVIGLEDAIKLPPVKVTTLPTASAETAGKMYYVGPDANDEYERYITSATGGSYSWIDLGDTSIPLPSIADNLTTNDANTALSAKQGVVLDGKVSQLGQEVNGANIALTGTTESGKYITSSGTKDDNASFKIVGFDVSGYSKVSVQVPSAATQSTPYYCFFTSSAMSTKVGTAARTNSLAGNTTEMIVPDGATYLGISIVSSQTPTVQVFVVGLDDRTEALEQAVAEIDTHLEQIDERLLWSDALAGLVFNDSEQHQLAKSAIKAVWLTYGNNVTAGQKSLVDALRETLSSTKLYITYLYNVAGTYGCFLRIDDAATSGNYCFSRYTEGIHTITGQEEVWDLLAQTGTIVWPSDSGITASPFALHLAIDWNELSNKTVTRPEDSHPIQINFGELNWGGRVETKDLHDEVEELSQTKPINLSGKNLVCIGDSITEIVDSNGKHYSDYLGDMTGATAINIGFGGTQLRQRRAMAADFDALPESTESEIAEKSRYAYATIDIINLVKAIVANDFTEQTKAVNWLANHNDDNTAILARVKAIDWSTMDGVTIFAGTNDWPGATIGTSGSTDVNYTLGAINEIIRLLLSTFKHLKIYWFTPIVRWVDYASGAGQDSDWSDVKSYSQENGNLRQFSKALMDEVLLNHIPCCDLYNTLGWNKYNFSNYFPANDGTHPQTIDGLSFLGKKIGAFILANNTL